MEPQSNIAAGISHRAPETFSIAHKAPEASSLARMLAIKRGSSLPFVGTHWLEELETCEE
jgi:hypothetical protein